MFHSLLPIQSTTMERHLEASVDRVTELPVDLNTLWDPERCPTALLPWLAWALSVDTWDSDWPEATRRAMIANSVPVHRSKGTVAAVERVLAALGVVAELTEWFEVDGPPYTFTLTAWVNANTPADSAQSSSTESMLLKAPLYQAIQRSVDAVKPVRSHYDFRVGVQLDNAMGLAGQTQSVSVVWTSVQPDTTVSMRTTVAHTLQLQSLTVVRATLEMS